MPFFTGLTEGFLRDLIKGRSEFELTDPFAQNGWVRRGLEAISRAIYDVPGRVVDPRDPERSKPLPEDDPRQWLRDLIKRPLPRVSRADLLSRSIALMHLDGGVFWLFEGLNGKLIGEGEIPSYIVVERARKLRPRFRPRTQVLIGWDRIPTGEDEDKPKFIQLHQACRFAFINPDDPYKCLSPLKAIWNDIEADFSAAVFNKTFFQKGTHVGGILTVEGNIPPEELDRISRFFDDKHGGPEKAGKPLVLGGGSAYIPPATQADMQYGEQRNLSREMILALLGVPGVLVGLFDGAPNASHLAQVGQFYENTVLPLMSLIEAVLEEQFPESPYRFDRDQINALDYNMLLQADQAKALKEIGIPQNEALKIAGIRAKEQPWGNTAWMPAGLIDAKTGLPMESPLNALLANPSETQPPANNLPAPEPSRLPERRNPLIPNRPPSTIQREDEPIDVEAELEGDDADEFDWSKGQGSFAPNRQLLEPGERILEPAYIAYAKELVAEQIALLKDGPELPASPEKAAKKPRPGQVETYLFSQEEWDRLFLRKLFRAYDSVSQLATAEAAKTVGVAPVLRGEAIERLLREKIVKASGFNAAMREKAAAIIAQGIAGGHPKAWIAAKLREDLALSEKRAKVIARTEVGQVVNSARALVFDKAGVQRKAWLAIPDSRCRATHKLLNRMQSVPMRHNYAVNLGRPGDILRWPHDMRGPAKEVVNCRCVLMPVLD